MEQEFSRWADIYDEAVGDLSTTTWEMGILAEVRQLPRKHHRILDIGGGSGIGARLLKSNFSCSVSTIDQSAEMLARSRGDFEEIFQHDFSDFDFSTRPFDLIVSGFDSLNYLSTAPLRNFFRSVARSLIPEGFLIFDYSSPKLLWEEWKEKEYPQRLCHGDFYWKHRFLPETLGSEILLSYRSDDGQVSWTERHCQFTHDTFQIYQLALSEGLEVTKVRNLKDHNFSPASNTHVYCLKPQSR